MTFLEIIILFLIAGIADSIGHVLVGFTNGSGFFSIALGFIGALIGTWLARKMDLPEIFIINVGKYAIPLVWAILGAVVFTTTLNLIPPRKRQ
jgi:uncharacterized membrane protein YeaQ/YmgE (transglycosylase-associated protein family)